MMNVIKLLSLVGTTNGLQLKPSDPKVSSEKTDEEVKKSGSDANTFQVKTDDGNTLHFATEGKYATTMSKDAGVFWRMLGFPQMPLRRYAEDGSLIYENPWEDMWGDAYGWPYAAKDQFPDQYDPPYAKRAGIGAKMDPILRAQFLTPEIIKRAATSVFGGLAILMSIAKMFNIPGQGTMDQLYFGMAVAPMVLALRVVFYVRMKLGYGNVKSHNIHIKIDKDNQENNHPNLDVLFKDFPDATYDPEGTIYGEKQDIWSPIAGYHGSLSEYLSRTPFTAWCFVFMITASLIGEMIRVNYKDGNAWDLPEIEYRKLWMFCSIAKNIGWFGVVMTTHFYGQWHDASTYVALFSSFAQTWCMSDANPNHFWKMYFWGLIGTGFGFAINEFIIKPHIPAPDPKKFPKWKNCMINTICLATWPIEWFAAILVYIILFVELAGHAMIPLETILKSAM